MSLLPKKEKFSILFDKHYNRLYNYCFKILKGKDISEELVQETFIKLWENFKDVNTSDPRSIESFLIVTLKNKIIDNYRKNQTRDKHEGLYFLNANLKTEIDNEWELSQQINVIYNSFDPKTVNIFQLSRDNGLTYKEIAAKKEISIKTVELHISKALTAFRKELKDFL